MKSLRILLVNEKGCFDPGIVALAKVLSARHRVVIAAPVFAQDGSGHALTTSRPLRHQQYFVLNKVKIFGVTGTPCDAVGLALDKLLLTPPDLVISGIDSHTNMGEHVYSSGNVSAAIAGTLHGVKSIAISAHIMDPKDEREYLNIARAFNKKLDFFIKNIPADTTLNINYPKNFRTTKKIMCAPLTTQMTDNTYTHEVSPYGREFYWMVNPAKSHTVECLCQHGDIYWVKNGFVTVTPLKYNLTSDDGIATVESANLAL